MIKPLGSVILIKHLAAEESVADGIVLPSSSSSRLGLKRAVVVATGKKDIPEDIKPGAVVLVHFGGVEIKVENEKHFLIDVSEVLAVEEAV